MKHLKLFAITIVALTTMKNAFGQQTINTKKTKNVPMLKVSENFTNNKKFFDDYTFIMTSGTYSSLSGATSINNNEIWDDPLYIIPIGFTFNLYDIRIDSLFFGLTMGGGVSNMLDSNSTYYNTFLILPFETDLIDRGYISGISQSPIQYIIEGNTGSRILKIEWKNAGFYDELDSLGTLNDSIDFQLWLFEENNNIEFHYGNSRITNPFINYYGETGPIVGLSDFGIANPYLLAGPSNNPTLTNSFSYLDGTPSNGIIYKFIKNNVAIKELKNNLNAVSIHPNPIENEALITFEKPLNNAVMTIFNPVGQKLKQINNISGQQIIFNREQLPSGLYLMQIMENNCVIIHEKIIIKN